MTESISNSKKGRMTRSRILWCLFFLSALIRIVALLDLSLHDIGFKYPLVDEMTNVDQARAFLKDGPGAGTPFWKPPGYPAFLALVGLLTGDLGPSGQGVPLHYAWIVKVLQVLLDSLATVLLARMAWDWAGRRAALLTGSLHSISWMSIFNCGQFLDTTLFSFFIVLAVDLVSRELYSTREVDRRTRTSFEFHWLVIGFITGWASITRAVALPLSLVFTILVIRHWRESPRRWNILAAYVFGLILTLSPVMSLNRWIGNDTVTISSNGGINLYIGNRQGEGIGSDGLTSVAAGPRWDDLLEKTAHLEKPSQRSAQYVSLTLQEIQENPGAWIKRLGLKAMALVSARDVPNNKNLVEETQRSWIFKSLSWLPGSSGGIISLAIFGAWRLRRELLTKALPLVLTIVVLGGLTWLFFIAGRYRVPLLALGCVLAGAGLFRTALNWKDGALFLFIATVVHGIPIPSDSLMASYCIDPIAIGYVHEQRQEPKIAEDWYLRSLTQDPDDVRALHNLGHLAQNRGEIVVAKKYFEQATSADPNHAPSWNSLGTLLVIEDGPEALRCVRRAVEIDPLYTNAWINLGQLFESQRMYPGALDAYQRARRQEPNNNLIILLETRVRLARNELRQAARLLRKISVDPPEPALRELRARLTQELDSQTNIVESPSEQDADPLTPTQP